MREMAWHRLKNAIIAISKSFPENLPVSDLWVCAVKSKFQKCWNVGFFWDGDIWIFPVFIGLLVGVIVKYW